MLRELRRLSKAIRWLLETSDDYELPQETRELAALAAQQLQQARSESFQPAAVERAITDAWQGEL